MAQRATELLRTASRAFEGVFQDNQANDFLPGTMPNPDIIGADSDAPVPSVHL